MMKQLKVWWAKKADYEKRRFFWIGGLTLVFVLSGSVLFVPTSLELNEDALAEATSIWDEDKISLLILGGVLLLSFVAIGLFPTSSGRTPRWDEATRRNRLTVKHPWTKKRD